jgi:hypothetical protein
MLIMKKDASILLIALGFSIVLAAIVPLEGLAGHEMTPEWTIDSENEFIEIDVSADGEYIAAAINNTNRLYVCRGNESIWYSSVGLVHSLAMSADGKYIAVGAESMFYFFSVHNSTPQLAYQLTYGNAKVATSADGNATAVGTTSHNTNNTLETRLHLFQKDEDTPTWTSTITGVLESLSISDDGSYVVASTSKPGSLYLFAKEHATPLWVYNFGERSRGAKISGNGNYVVAVGGNQTGYKEMRIYRFLRQTSQPNYVKVISELPSFQGVSISANGSIFAISYAEANRLIMFNLELPPYGYGPGSVLNVSLPSPRVSMSMSADGRHIIVGTLEGLFTYEYVNRQLELKNHYTVNKPFINDVASSADGRYVAAAVTVRLKDNKNSMICFFDNFKEPKADIAHPWLQPALIVVTAAVILATATFILRRKRKQRSDRSSQSRKTSLMK